jgi:hypothetical protein
VGARMERARRALTVTRALKIGFVPTGLGEL